MTPKDDLFQLIKSMDRNEKGYFKKFAALNGKKDNNYVLLFDAINQQTEYDEAVLKQQFKGEKFIVQLHVVKNYLFKLILKSLRNYHQETTTPLKLYNLLIDTELLCNRRMRMSAKKVLDKTLPLLQLEEPTQLVFKPIMHKSLNRIYAANFYDDLTDEELWAWGDKYIDDTNKLAIHVQYEVLLAKIGRLHDHISWADTPEDKAKFDELMDNPIMKVDPDTLPFITQVGYYDILSIYQIATRQHLAFLENTDKMVELDKKLDNISCSQRISTLFNNILANSLHLRFEKAAYSLQALKDIVPPMQKDRVLQRRCIVRLEMDIALRDANQANLPQWLAKNLDYINEVIDNDLSPLEIEHYRFYLSKLYIRMGDYNTALDLINGIIQSKEMKGDYNYNLVWVVLIICNYEVGNHLVVPYLLKSMHTQYSKKGGYPPTEKIFVRGLKKILKTRSQDQPALFAQIRKDLIQSVSDPYQLQLSVNIDILNWLNNKLGLTGYDA